MTKIKYRAAAPKPKQVWIDKFHPNNGRLTMIRLNKLSAADLRAWIKIGRREIRRFTLRDEFFLQWRAYGHGPTHMSMREWCEGKVRLLLRMLDRWRA